MRCRGQAFLFLRPKLLKISYENDLYIYVIGLQQNIFRTYTCVLGRQNDIPTTEGVSILRPWPVKGNISLAEGR